MAVWLPGPETSYTVCYIFSTYAKDPETRSFSIKLKVCNRNLYTQHLFNELRAHNKP